MPPLMTLWKMILEYKYAFDCRDLLILISFVRVYTMHCLRVLERDWRGVFHGARLEIRVRRKSQIVCPAQKFTVGKYQCEDEVLLAMNALTRYKKIAKASSTLFSKKFLFPLEAVCNTPSFSSIPQYPSYLSLTISISPLSHPKISQK